MVARLVRDQKAAGSNPATSTRKTTDFKRNPVVFCCALYMMVCLAGWDNGQFGSRSSIWQGKWQFSCVLRARKPLISKGLRAFCVGNQAGKYERVSKFARRISGIFSCTSASSNLDLPPVNLRFSSLNCKKICSKLHLSHFEAHADCTLVIVYREFAGNSRGTADFPYDSFRFVTICIPIFLDRRRGMGYH